MARFLTRWSGALAAAVIVLAATGTTRSWAQPNYFSQLAPVEPAAEFAITTDALAQSPWRSTFAAPVPGNPHETLYFERRYDNQARIWRLDWQQHTARAFALPALPLQDKVRYTALVSAKGLWLIGPRILLIQPNGVQQALPFDADEPTAVALKDGSVLVLGNSLHNHTEQMRRLVSTPQGITVEDKGLLPNALSGKNVSYVGRFGVAAVTLADGSVMTAGGGTDQQRVALVDPLSGQVKPLADMPHRRAFAVLLPLPDGRVVAAGSEFLNCMDDNARAVDIYDPRLNDWRALPDLPFALCSEAYGAYGASGAVLPNGTVVLGGHLEQHLLALRPSTASANGFAGFWEVMGPTQRQRISGVVQAVTDTEVVIAGGVHKEASGCCSGTPGADLVSLPAQPGQQANYQSFGLPLLGTGAAQRGQRVFIVAGRQFSTTSSGQIRYSRMAELVDLRTGHVQQLPPLPFSTGSAQVAWLDDDRIVVKGLAVKRHVGMFPSGFTSSSTSSADLPASSGAVAVYSIQDQRWSAAVDHPEIRNSTLMNVKGEAVFLSQDGLQYRLKLPGMQLELLPATFSEHTGTSARRLQDGRTILAGTLMQDDFISVIDEACEKSALGAAGQCPEQYRGWGVLRPSARYGWFTAADNGDVGQWHWSAPSRAWQTWLTGVDDKGLGELIPAGDLTSGDYRLGEALPSVIDAEGRVTRLIGLPAIGPAASEPKQWRMERSDSQGGVWQALPIPSVGVDEKGRLLTCPRGCRVLLADDPRQPGKELMFLREGELEVEGFWDFFAGNNSVDGLTESVRKPLRIWWFDESLQTWHDILRAPADGLRGKPLALNAPLSDDKNQMLSMGWHLERPILWLSH